MAGDGIQQSSGDFVGVGIQESHPAKLLNLCQTFEEERQPVFQTQVFSVAGGVLADESNFANAPAARRSASATTDSKWRERNLPRSCGMMQKPQGWSQPSA